ncbi:MAG TPA: rRNA adenine N-6-methyltransferase family protein [Ktedonobacterales bacterium]
MMRPEPEYPRRDAGLLALSPADEAEASRLRGEMVERLRASGAIHDPAVAEAMLSVPRHLFLPRSTLLEAYENVAVATRWEQGAAVSSVSQPEIVAMMLEQLHLTPGMRVLEIGAGAGYNAALLAELVGPNGSVTTIELDPELAAEAATHLAAAGYSPARARVIAGDGWIGWAPGAPWDRIEATVGVWDISPHWVEQLGEYGLLLAPLWLGVTDVSVALRKRAGALVSESWALCGFVRLRGDGAGQPPTIAIGGRRSVSGPGAEALAERVRVALSLPARRVRWERPGSGFIPSLALMAGGMLTIWQSRPAGWGRPRGRYALYREGEDGPSLVVFPERPSSFLVFGGRAAELFVREQAQRRQDLLAPSSWRLEVRPTPGEPPPLEGVIRQRTPHWVYDISVSQEVMGQDAPGT